MRRGPSSSRWGGRRCRPRSDSGRAAIRDRACRTAPMPPWRLRQVRTSDGISIDQSRPDRETEALEPIGRLVGAAPGEARAGNDRDVRLTR